ncbi:MAG: 5'/3'-nucleotidase SurE [Alphaproteobacteria bacterium]|nr:5'/3'-nucleotidase SurE [Alphaproteobacteria bacterium]MBF0251474.1 5'/3'-nucleotidase SurE [Alphaproteobacteria bacterium]
MRDRVPNLARARVLISNDDGVDAPGIKALERAMKRVAGEVWVVAPETEQSAASHSLTLRQPLRIHKRGARRFAVTGTPTDAVLLGVQHVMKDARPDIVLSGVNRGGNLGEDVTYSGTVAAAMEGTLLGIPSVAFSLVTPDGAKSHWSTAEHWVEQVMKRLAGVAFQPGVLINVNIPDVPPAAVTGIEVTRQGRRKIGCEIQEGRDPKGKPYYWIGAQRDEDRSRPGTDLEAVGRGAVSLTPLSMELGHRGMMKTLKEALG